MVMPAPSTFKALQPGTHLSLGDGVTRHILERAGHSGTAVGDHVYIIGGRRGSRYYTDLLRLNVKERVWEKVYSQLPFHPRANHIAVAVKHNIWVFGGSDNKIVLSDIWVLDTNTLHWTQPQLSGQPDLLCRCAAGADLAPNNPNCIIVCGGYGFRNPDMVAYDYYNDIVVIDTQRMWVDQIKVSGTPPSPRCFHTFTTVGNRCYLLGGRRLDEFNRVLEVAVYDSVRSAWVEYKATGEPPHPRSSHRAISLGNRMLLTGGIIDDASRHMDADLIVTLHTGDDRSPVAQLEWSTVDQPQRCLKYDWPQGRGGHSCCLVKNQVLLLLGYTGYENKVYLPEVLSFEVSLPGPSKPVSPATTVGLAIPQAAQPEPLVTPALHHPAPAGLVVHAAHHRIARHTSTVGHVPVSPLKAGPGDAKGAKQAPGARDIIAEAEEELDEYDVCNVPSVDPAPHLVRQSRTGTGKAAKTIDLTTDDKAEERVKKAGKGAKQGGGPSQAHGRSPGRSPAREEVVPGSPGEGGWRLSKGANRASQAALLPTVPVHEESEPWAHKRQRTGRSPGPAAGRTGPGHRSGAGASPADAAATRGRRPADAQAGAGRCSPGQGTKAPNQVERLQADVHRLQEDLKRSRQSEAAAEERAKGLKATLEHQKTNFESECALLRTKLVEKDAIVQSKAGELLSTQQAYGEAIRQVKDHQLQMDRKQHEIRDLAAENAKLNQDHTALTKKLNDAEVGLLNAEAKVSSLEIELRSSHLKAQASMEDVHLQLRQRQASYEKVQLSYDALTDHQAKSVARVAELQDQLARNISEANDAKHKAAQQLLELSAVRDTEQRAAEAAKAEARGLQQRNGMLEYKLGQQNAAVEDLKRQLSAATAELTQAKASLHTAKEELEALKGRHEQLVKAGVEIAQDLRGPLEAICKAKERSKEFEEEDARMQIQRQQQQTRQQAQQMLEQQRQEQQRQQQQQQQLQQQQQQQLQQQQLQQQQQQQQLQQQQPLQQTELQVPQFPLAPQPLGSSPQCGGLAPGSSNILGPPPQICSTGPSIPGGPSPSNAVR